MARVTYEFNCTNCPAIFNVKLNITINGNRRIHCPKCNHIHFRKVIDGEITDTRFTENTQDPLVEDIYPMPSSVIDKTKEKEKETTKELSGFMHRLWKDRICSFE